MVEFTFDGLGLPEVDAHLFDAGVVDGLLDDLGHILKDHPTWCVGELLPECHALMADS